MSAKNVLVIFGITGDLSHRKLLPALHHLAEEGYLDDTVILGISRRSVTVDEVLAGVPEADTIRDRLHVFTMDISEADEYKKLKSAVNKLRSKDGMALYYLSVPPQASIAIVELLGQAGLNDERTKVLLEKPFGVDYESAYDAVETIERHFSEPQLYRIDHYLAKEMTQNIIAFRGRNALLRNVWDSGAIESIDIIASESIGIENRAEFYEQTGALRDVLQNHLMQLMALVLMDIPTDMKTSDIPGLRLKALQAIKPVQADEFTMRVQRGQYEGYAKEVGNPGSLVETFASVTLYSSDPKWEDVPIRLATGKGLAEQATEVRVYFRREHGGESNRLAFLIQPREGIEIDLLAKKHGYEKEYENVSLSFNYRERNDRPIEAYERVLVDALTSDKSLFTTTDEVIRSWEILRPVQERWAFHTDDLMQYEPGTPIEALIEPNP